MYYIKSKSSLMMTVELLLWKWPHSPHSAYVMYTCLAGKPRAIERRMGTEPAKTKSEK